jgi:homoserine dehydrogenase
LSIFLHRYFEKKKEFLKKIKILLQNGKKYAILSHAVWDKQFDSHRQIRRYTMIQIAVLGYGNIGSGVVDLLLQNRDLIRDQIGDEVNVKYILDIRDFQDHPLQDRMTKDFSVILQDPEVSIVAEMMGGSHPAYDFTLSLLKAGKNVVTSNKEVVANFGDELLQIAAEHGVRYLFEASVGGGIPIIRPMQHSLAGDSICEVTGILNGTTNYILTQMTQNGCTMQEALQQAQKLGYAEANPAADVQCMDACRKICILAALAFGKLVTAEDVETTGIAALTPRDIHDAAKINRNVKLIAHAVETEDGALCLSVAPHMVPQSSPLYSVEDVFNGILVRGRAVGEVMFYGKGAGKYPTAAAVNSDIMEIAANTKNTAKAVSFTRVAKETLASSADLVRPYYLRVSANDFGSMQSELISQEDGLTAGVVFGYSYREIVEICEKEELKMQSCIPLL